MTMDDAKKLEILATIMRASHFQWRRAALAACPDQDPQELVNRYWQEVGKDTAKFYLRKIDPERDLADQVAALFAASSEVMGEQAEVLEKSPEGHSQVRHAACPWFDWHRREGLLAEDQPGCDFFLQVVMDEINRALNTSLRFRTVESLPGGGRCCLRQIWEEGK
jgi:hypothetical protein